MKISTPKSFGVDHVKDFLNDAQVIFRLENKETPGFVFDLSKTKHLGLIGQLLIYKFISYTAEHRCFSSPEILSSEEQWVENKLREYGFFDIIMAYVKKSARQKILSSYKSLALREVLKDNTRVIIAPQRLLRDEVKMRDDLEQKLFSELYQFYGKNNSSQLGTTCIGELLTNFWSHATEDSGTVMVAMGNKYYIEICIADNGIGIVSSLKASNEAFRNMSPDKVLIKSTEKGITSKPRTSHMGLGLFIIKEIAKANNGQLSIYSEGAFLEERSAKTLSGLTGFWKGTIVYLRLDFSNPIPLSSIASLQPTRGLDIDWR